MPFTPFSDALDVRAALVLGISLSLSSCCWTFGTVDASDNLVEDVDGVDGVVVDLAANPRFIAAAGFINDDADADACFFTLVTAVVATPLAAFLYSFIAILSHVGG